MMKKIGTFEILEALVKATGKPHMYIAFDSSSWADDSIEQFLKVLPYMAGHEDAVAIFCDGFAYIQFDSDDEMEHAFLETEHDESECPVYALYVDSKLEGSENT